jgi:hypothetical protein
MADSRESLISSQSGAADGKSAAAAPFRSAGRCLGARSVPLGEPLTQNAKDLHARSEAEVQSKRTSLGDDFRPVDIGVRRMSAMQTTEFGLGFAVAAIGKTAHLALLRSVSRIVLNGFDAEPVFEVSKASP